MGVPKFKRKLSNLYIYDESRKLRLEIVSYFNNFFKDDRLYKDNTLLAENIFHKDLINEIIKKILSLLSDLETCISIADSIYPMNYTEFYQRLIYQNKAKGLSKSIMQELIFLSDLFPDKLNGLLILADKLNSLYSGINNWKKSSNGILKRLDNSSKEDNKNKFNVPIEVFDI